MGTSHLYQLLWLVGEVFLCLSCCPGKLEFYCGLCRSRATSVCVCVCVRVCGGGGGRDKKPNIPHPKRKDSPEQSLQLPDSRGRPCQLLLSHCPHTHAQWTYHRVSTRELSKVLSRLRHVKTKRVLLVSIWRGHKEDFLCAQGEPHKGLRGRNTQ